jgi:excisionase family DNA binding protein
MMIKKKNFEGIRNPAELFVGGKKPQQKQVKTQQAPAAPKSAPAEEERPVSAPAPIPEVQKPYLPVEHNGGSDRIADRVEQRAAKVESMYKLTEVEKILKVTNRTVLSYIASGQLKGIKIGGSWRITEESLDRMLEPK